MEFARLASLCQAFQETAAARPHAVALRTPDGEREFTWAEYAARVRSIAGGLAALGVGSGETVALMMTNRPEFALCDTAALHTGATPFSVYNTSTAEQIQHLFSNAGNRVVICEQQFLSVIAAARPATAVEHVVCVDGGAGEAVGLDDLELGGGNDGDFETRWQAVGPGDVLTLIYTSGTTGPPKGVEITHANMLAELAATAAVLPLGPGDRTPSYLPSAHIADRWMSHYRAMAHGLEITYVTDPRAVIAVLPDVRPTIWGAVPRVWEKLKAGLEAKLAAEPDAQRRAALEEAIALGVRKVRADQAALAGAASGPDRALLDAYALADERVLGPLREALGLAEVRWSVSGAAPTPVEVLEFFAAIGLPICELWGMSELSCCATINPIDRIKIGTVGPAVPGLELALADDNELLCRGPLVMRGYRRDPEKTAEALAGDGWLRTGDIATIDADGYVRIVDRKKELIINAAGKNMSPANIEARLKTSCALIGQAVAIGDGRPYNVALIVLDPDACGAHAAAHGLDDASPQALAGDADVHETVARGVAAANDQLSRVEQIKRFVILPVDWEPGGDELTPTSKLKRRPIADKYAVEIEGLYAAERAAAGASGR